MRRYTRQQLKEDRFQEATAETLDWAVGHQKVLIISAIVVLVVVGIVIGAWVYLQNQDTKASVDLGRAIRTYDAPLRPQGAPADPQQESFSSVAERAKAAQDEFKLVAQQFPHTRSADFAHYYIGLTAIDLGDNATAERELKEMSSTRDADLAALAKMALAGFYRNQNKQDEAVKIYKDLEAHPTATVPKVRAQLEMASMYEDKQPDEARKLYQQIIKDDVGGPAAQIAQGRLGSMK